ncbi:MAG: hypothetical protein LBF71_05280 [Campylobacteraceae bacterium]|jgi:hypothetical protein|nr:hypothetical protein [Campylobacteraceae bacterium]
MEWLAIIVLLAFIFYISKKYDNEIKMLNKMIELNRGIIDENSKNIKSEQKKRSEKIKPEKSKTIKKNPAKKIKNADNHKS